MLAGTTVYSQQTGTDPQSAAIESKALKSELLFNTDSIAPAGIAIKGAAQGMAIHRNYLFSFHDRGLCVIFDIKKGDYVNSFQLEGNKTHCNSANFGKEKYSKESVFPLLYISECGGRNCCNVTDITLEGSKIVQKIFYSGADAARFFDWSVDAKGGWIYTYGGAHMKPKTLRKYKLPTLADSDEKGEVHLTEKDLVEEYTVDCVKIAQGNHISGRYAWFTDGGKPLTRAIHKYDLKKKETAATYVIDEISFEPEDIDFFGSHLILQDFTGKTAREAMIYKIKLK
jgi:hypothetical protein